jgi:hypothetical protein
MPMPYMVECRQIPGPGRIHVLTECHATLVSALDAMADHQHRGWDSVRLTAVPAILTVPSAGNPVAVGAQQIVLPFGES